MFLTSYLSESRRSIFTRTAIVQILGVVLLLTLTSGTAEAAKKKKKKKGDEDAVIAGVVKVHEGNILEGVLVKVTAADPAGFRAEVTTDKSGEFEVTIPQVAGEYQVELSKDGYAPFEATFEFLPGEQKNITFTLLDAAAGRRQEAVNAYNAGADAFNSDRRDEAKAKFLEAVGLDPQVPEPHLPLAEIFLADGDFEKAASHAESFLVLQPGSQNAQVVAHEAYRKLGNQAKVEEFQSILSAGGLASHLAVQVFNEGAQATQEGEWAAAVEKFEEALSLDPKLTNAYSVLAQIHYSQEAFDKALVAADKLLELEPENVSGRRYRFLVLEARGDAAADEALDAWVEVDATGASDVLYQKADLDFRAGNIEAAKRALLKVIELQPELARAHYTLGKVFAQSDAGKAKEHLQKFIELAPDDPEVASAKKMLSYF